MFPDLPKKSQSLSAACDRIAFECQKKTPGSQPSCVLTIDDDDDIALALKLRINRIGLRVVRAVDGIEGLRIATQTPHDLLAIILDYELPGGNGDLVLRKLKTSLLTSEIPVIAMTGRHDQGVEQRMRSLGAYEFLYKPYDWQQLKPILLSLPRRPQL